jgi:hypothetical protein
VRHARKLEKETDLHVGLQKKESSNLTNRSVHLVSDQRPQTKYQPTAIDKHHVPATEHNPAVGKLPDVKNLQDENEQETPLYKVMTVSSSCQDQPQILPKHTATNSNTNDVEVTQAQNVSSICQTAKWAQALRRSRGGSLMPGSVGREVTTQHDGGASEHNFSAVQSVDTADTLKSSELNAYDHTSQTQSKEQYGNTVSSLTNDTIVINDKSQPGERDDKEGAQGSYNQQLISLQLELIGIRMLLEETKSKKEATATPANTNER